VVFEKLGFFVLMMVNFVKWPENVKYI